MNTYEIIFSLVGKDAKMTLTIQADGHEKAIFAAGVEASVMRDAFGQGTELEFVDWTCVNNGYNW